MEASSNSYSNYNNNLLNINTLAPDLYEIVLQLSGTTILNAVDRKCATLGQKVYKKAYGHMVDLYLPLKAVVAEKEKNDNPAGKIFIQCVNQLSDKAKDLGCDLQISSELNPLRRMLHELFYYKTLISTIQAQLKLNELFLEMLAVLDLSDKYTKTQKDEFKSIITVIQSIPFKKEEMLEQSGHFNIGGFWIPRGSQWVIEFPSKVCKIYTQLKKTNNLDAFFAVFICNKYTNLEYYKINLNLEFVKNLIDNNSLAQLINKEETKIKNLNDFFIIFSEYKALYNKNIYFVNISIEFVKRKEINDVIKNCTPQDFINFLKEAYIVGKKTSDSIIMNEDLENYGREIFLNYHVS